MCASSRLSCHCGCGIAWVHVSDVVPHDTGMAARAVADGRAPSVSPEVHIYKYTKERK